MKNTATFLFFLLLSTKILCQEDAEFAYVSIILHDKTHYEGILIKEYEDHIILSTKFKGTRSLNKSDIRSKSIISKGKMKKDDFWPDSPLSTKYLFLPNGYGLKAGQAYYQNIWILFQEINVGITEYFSLGAGAIPLSIFGGRSPFWVIPKFSLPMGTEYAGFSAGAYLGRPPGFGSSFFAVSFAKLTLGSRDSNFDIGVGWNMEERWWGNRPLFHVGTTQRVSANSYLLVDYINLNIFDDLVGALALSYRYAGIKFGLDFGLYFIRSSQRFNIPAPIIGAFVPLYFSKS